MEDNYSGNIALIYSPVDGGSNLPTWSREGKTTAWVRLRIMGFITSLFVSQAVDRIGPGCSHRLKAHREHGDHKRRCRG